MSRHCISGILACPLFLRLFFYLDGLNLKGHSLESIDIGWFPGDANQSVHLVASEGLEAYLPLADMVDISTEVQRLSKRLAKMQTEYDGLMARLSSPSVMQPLHILISSFVCFFSFNNRRVKSILLLHTALTRTSQSHDLYWLQTANSLWIKPLRI